MFACEADRRVSKEFLQDWLRYVQSLLDFDCPVDVVSWLMVRKLGLLDRDWLPRQLSSLLYLNRFRQNVLYLGRIPVPDLLYCFDQNALRCSYPRWVVDFEVPLCVCFLRLLNVVP